MRERPPRDRRREDVAVAGSGTETVNEVGADGLSMSAPAVDGNGPVKLLVPE
jgi:hypothetical protein